MGIHVKRKKKKKANKIDFKIIIIIIERVICDIHFEIDCIWLSYLGIKQNTLNIWSKRVKLFGTDLSTFHLSYLLLIGVYFTAMSAG